MITSQSHPNNPHNQQPPSCGHVGSIADEAGFRVKGELGHPSSGTPFDLPFFAHNISRACAPTSVSALIGLHLHQTLSLGPHNCDQSGCEDCNAQRQRGNAVQKHCAQRHGYCLSCIVVVESGVFFLQGIFNPELCTVPRPAARFRQSL
jgi:hypothetical protein